MLSGKKSYDLEVPAGPIDLWVDWLSDKFCQVWLHYASGMRVPIAEGLRNQINLRTENLSGVTVCTDDPKATLVVCCMIKDRKFGDAAEFEPAVISPPKPAELQMSLMVTRAVQRQLLSMGLKEGTIDVDDEDDLEEDDDDEGFGPGFMEDDEPTSLARAAAAGARARAGATAPEPAKVSKDGGDVPSPGGADGASGSSGD